MNFLLFLLMVSATVSGGILINLSESENPENDEKQKNSHMISAIVMMTALALILGTFIVIPLIFT